jgi:hypothetical protein
MTNTHTNTLFVRPSVLRQSSAANPLLGILTGTVCYTKRWSVRTWKVSLSDFGPCWHLLLGLHDRITKTPARPRRCAPQQFANANTQGRATPDFEQLLRCPTANALPPPLIPTFSASSIRPRLVSASELKSFILWRKHQLNPRWFEPLFRTSKACRMWPYTCPLSPLSALHHEDEYGSIHHPLIEPA